MALQILRILLNYNLYLKYGSNIEYVFEDSKELTLLYKSLVKLHEKYNRDLTIEEYCLSVLINCQEKDKENLSSLLKDLREIDGSSVVLEDLLRDVSQRQKAHDLALLSLDVAEGRKDFDDLVVATTELTKDKAVSTGDEFEFVTSSLEELYNNTVKQKGLRWRIHTLNKMLGSLRKSDFGFIFARSETGKTTFLASEISHFASQTDKPILWFANEEDGAKIKSRIYQATLGVTTQELFNDLSGNQQKYMELTGDRIKVFDRAAIHRKQVEHLCRELEPGCIVIDQLDKIKGFTDDREDLRLGSIYIWARELAKQYCPVIAVSQAAASGEGKKYLTMDDVSNAKTAKQAEADWILGIGKSHADSDEYIRYFHLSKNKLTGDEDTDPELRHGKAMVRIEPSIARYLDLPE